MKLTPITEAIDDVLDNVARLTSENARLRQKNRNYKLQLKQLTRAHIVTLRELELAREREQRAAQTIERGDVQPVIQRAMIGYIGADIAPEKIDADVSFDHPL